MPLLPLLYLLLWPTPTGAAPRGVDVRPASVSKKASTAADRRGHRTHAKPKPPPPVPLAPAKVAVLGFEGDGADPVRAQVVRALRLHGYRVTTTLRPVDSPDQYREMAVALKLCAYLEGEVVGEGEARGATIYVRGAYSGMREASATITASSRRLPAEVGHTLWKRLGLALTKTRADAAKPPRPQRDPLRIDAGKPLDPA